MLNMSPSSIHEVFEQNKTDFPGSWGLRNAAGICCDANMSCHPRTVRMDMLAGGWGPGDWRPEAGHLICTSSHLDHRGWGTSTTVHSGKQSQTECTSVLVETLGETEPQVLSSCCRSNFAVCLQQLACFAYLFGWWAINVWRGLGLKLKTSP